MADGTAIDDTLYNARPTLRFGEQPDERATALVERLSMSEGEGGLRSLELGLSNWASFDDGSAGYAFDASAQLRLGGPIEIYCGPVERPRELFRGHITGLESVHQRGQPPQLCVYAEDALLAARLQRRSAVHADQSPAAVFRAVAARLGLEVTVAALERPVATWVQVDETDLAFLRRLAGRLDADLQVAAGGLHVSPRSEVQRPPLRLDAGADLRSIRVFADLADQVTSVTARGWDAAAGSAVRAEVGAGSHLGPGRGRDGASLLRAAFGERPDNLGHCAVGSDAEARALAEAAFDHRARRLVRASGVTEGNPSLRVGATVTLTGLGQRYDNDYYVTATRHCYDLREGYRTEFSAECAYLGGTA
jgi:phage protein D